MFTRRQPWSGRPLPSAGDLHRAVLLGSPGDASPAVRAGIAPSTNRAGLRGRCCPGRVEEGGERPASRVPGPPRRVPLRALGCGCKLKPRGPSSTGNANVPQARLTSPGLRSRTQSEYRFRPLAPRLRRLPGPAGSPRLDARPDHLSTFETHRLPVGSKLPWVTCRPLLRRGRCGRLLHWERIWNRVGFRNQGFVRPGKSAEDRGRKEQRLRGFGSALGWRGLDPGLPAPCPLRRAGLRFRE